MPAVKKECRQIKGEENSRELSRTKFFARFRKHPNRNFKKKIQEKKKAEIRYRENTEKNLKIFREKKGREREYLRSK